MFCRLTIVSWVKLGIAANLALIKNEKVKEETVMKETNQLPQDLSPTPMLFPFDPQQFWQHLRILLRDEITRLSAASTAATPEEATLNPKPLYKISEVCQLFQVTKPTVYAWIEHGKLHPVKIRSRVFFLWQDIQNLITGSRGDAAATPERAG